MLKSFSGAGPISSFPISVNGARGAVAQAFSRPIDLIMVSDSNQVFGGYGWDDGWQSALAAKYGLYATGILSNGDNVGNGSRNSLFVQIFGNNGSSLVYTGAGGYLDQYLKSAALPLLSYAYQASGAATAAVGASLYSGALNLNHSLRGHYVYGTFASGAGQFQPSCRLEVAPYTTLVTGSAINTNDGIGGNVGIATLDIPPNSAGAATQLGFRYTPVGTGVTGPFLGLYQRFEDRSLNVGASAHTMLPHSGGGLYDFVNDVRGTPDLELWLFFSLARMLQVQKGLTPIIVMIVNSGVNDRNYGAGQQPSLGPASNGVGNSATAYIDNLAAFRIRIEALYGRYWPLYELFWVVMPSHPVSNPDNASLLAYRSAAITYASQQPRTVAIDLGALTSFTEMTANGWYDGGGPEHLTQAGYEALAARALTNLVS